MAELVNFALAVLLVLSVPGPTNTLLALAGAAKGLRKTLFLVATALAGYLLSIFTLAIVLGPAATACRSFALGLRLACGVYLCYAAWIIWKSAVAEKTSHNTRDVFVATMLNPKGFVVAFGIFPTSSAGTIEFLFPYLAIFSGLCVLATSAWILFGAFLRHDASSHSLRIGVQRIGAVILGLFAGAILTSTFSLVP